MKRILQRQETATLSMSNLRKALPHYCKIVRYDTMKGKTLKQALGGKKVMIVLWNLHDIKHRVLNKPGHFFAISVLQGAPVVFSSTGWSPMKEAIITHSDISILNNMLPKNTEYNNVKMQLSDDSNTCWRYCIMFSHLHRSFNLKMIQQLMKKGVYLQTSDDIVTMMTLLELL